MGWIKEQCGARTVASKSTELTEMTEDVARSDGKPICQRAAENIVK